MTQDTTTVLLTALPTGTQIHQYTIEKLLGRGGFGIVYRAKDESLDCHVAIKEYLPEQLATRTQDNSVSPHSAGITQTMFVEWKNNFIKEARQIAQLDHPSIVRVMQIFEANNTAYMVMPYYTGESLKKFQKRTNKQWTEAEIKTLLDPLLNALEVLHERNILHHDIAPDNIFIKDNGQPLLLDFGAARHIATDQTLSQNLLYKHGYSPIEQYSIEGKSQAGAWSDIYSLSAVIYELITGEKVSPAPSRAAGESMPTLKSRHLIGFSENFINSIDLALSVNLKKRPQTVKEWREYMTTGKLSTPIKTVETKPVNYKNLIIIFAVFITLSTLSYGGFIIYQKWQQKTIVAQKTESKIITEQTLEVENAKIQVKPVLETPPQAKIEPEPNNQPPVIKQPAVKTIHDIQVVYMPKPPFDYYLSNNAVAKNTMPIKLKQIKATSNNIIDTQDWFLQNNLPNLEETKLRDTRPPDHLPSSYQNYMLTDLIDSGEYSLLVYGKNFASNAFLFIWSKEKNEFTQGYNFETYNYSPTYVKLDKEFIEQQITWATIENNILYISHTHMTYAASSHNMNAYITAIDLNTNEILWRSKPLVSNSRNFVIHGDFIITGYGFTAEPDFLFILDKWTGKVINTIKLKSGPEYIIEKDNQLFVRTYDMDYIYDIIN